MKKSPLIGISILAVILLVLGSFTNVVGYQSVKSSGVNGSPLFSVRTKRATNQAREDNLTSNYLGKGKENLIRFPIRDNKTELMIKAIQYIGKMNDETFILFTEVCIQQSKQDTTLTDTTTDEIVSMLQIIRTRPDSFINSLINKDNHYITSSNISTICQWFPGCIPAKIVAAIMALILVIGFLLICVLAKYFELHSMVFTCQGDSFCYNSKCFNK
jgi:hypothetical protein